MMNLGKRIARSSITTNRVFRRNCDSAFESALHCVSFKSCKTYAKGFDSRVRRPRRFLVWADNLRVSEGVDVLLMEGALRFVRKA